MPFRADSDAKICASNVYVYTLPEVPKDQMDAIREYLSSEASVSLWWPNPITKLAAEAVQMFDWLESLAIHPRSEGRRSPAVCLKCIDGLDLTWHVYTEGATIWPDHLRVTGSWTSEYLAIVAAIGRVD